MPVIRKTIRSSSRPDNTFPWAKVTLDPITRALDISEFNGLMDATKEAAVRGVRVLALTAGKLTEPHALYVDLAGVLRFTAFSDQPPVVYAHLAFYYPVTQVVEVLDFIEMGAP